MNRKIIVFMVVVSTLMLSYVSAGGKYRRSPDDIPLKANELPKDPMLGFIILTSFEEWQSFVDSELLKNAKKIIEIGSKLSKNLQLIRRNCQGQFIWINQDYIKFVESSTNKLIIEMNSYRTLVIKDIEQVKRKFQMRTESKEPLKSLLQKLKSMQTMLRAEIQVQMYNLIKLQNIKTKIIEQKTGRSNHLLYQYLLHSDQEQEGERPPSKKLKKMVDSSQLLEQQSEQTPHLPLPSPPHHTHHHPPIQQQIPFLSPPLYPPPFQQHPPLPPLSPPPSSTPHYSPPSTSYSTQQQHIKLPHQSITLQKPPQHHHTPQFQTQQSRTTTTTTMRSIISSPNQLLSGQLSSYDLPSTSVWNIPQSVSMSQLSYYMEEQHQPSDQTVVQEQKSEIEEQKSDTEEELLTFALTDTVLDEEAELQAIKNFNQNPFESRKPSIFLMNFNMLFLNNETTADQIIRLLKKDLIRFYKVKDSYNIHSKLLPLMCFQYLQFKFKHNIDIPNKISDQVVQKQYYKFKSKMKIMIKSMGFGFGYLQMLLNGLHRTADMFKYLSSYYKLNIFSKFKKMMKLVQGLIDQIKSFKITDDFYQCTYQKKITMIPQRRPKVTPPTEILMNGIFMKLHFEPYPLRPQAKLQEQIQTSLQKLSVDPKLLKNQFILYRYEIVLKKFKYNQCVEKGEKIMRRIAQLISFRAKLETNEELVKCLIQRSNGIKILEYIIDFCRIMLNVFETHGKNIQGSFGMPLDQRQFFAKIKAELKELIAKSLSLRRDVYKSSEQTNPKKSK